VDVDQYTGKSGERIDVFVQDATCQRVKVTVLDPTQGGANALGAVVEEAEGSRGARLSLGLSDEDGLSERPIRQTLPFTHRSRRPTRQCRHAYCGWGVVIQLNGTGDKGHGTREGLSYRQIVRSASRQVGKWQ
jgi:hypothetical protein